MRALPQAVEALPSVVGDDRVAGACTAFLQNAAFYVLSMDREGSEDAGLVGDDVARACAAILEASSKDAVALAAGAAVGTLACCRRAKIDLAPALEALKAAGSRFGGKVKECADDAADAQS